MIGLLAEASSKNGGFGEISTQGAIVAVAAIMAFAFIVWALVKD